MRSAKGDPQIVRCLALLIEMGRSRDGVPLRPLAERRGWNLRALYRDVDALQGVGVPVRKNGDHYSVDAAWLPPGAAGVTKPELMALFIARSLAPGLRETSFGKLLDSMQKKLAAPGRQTVLDLDREGVLSVRMFAPIDYSQHRATIDALDEGIRLRRAVAIRYRRPNGEMTERDIEPGYLHWDGALEAMYVPSWCRLRDDVRNFAVHRILSVRVTEERFSPRPETRRSELTRAFRLWYRRQQERVVIWFAPDIAGEIRERKWHSSQRIRDRPDGAVELHLDISSPDELSRWLLGFGPAAVVLEPLRLAVNIRASHTAAAAKLAPTESQATVLQSVHRARHRREAEKQPKAGSTEARRVR